MPAPSEIGQTLWMPSNPPQLVALVSGSGSGSKFYHSLLDGHPQIAQLPGYPLLYFYPHWIEWTGGPGGLKTWPELIDRLIECHGSIIDTQRVPSHDGLSNLGKGDNGSIAINEDTFRNALTTLLEDQPISSRNFLIAIHLAYAFCRGQQLSEIRCILYHIHYLPYLVQYLNLDFPDLKVLTMFRDPRPNLRRRIRAEHKTDDQKLNPSDAETLRLRAINHQMETTLLHHDWLASIGPDRVRVVRHEDLGPKLREVMVGTARFLGVQENDCLGKSSFGGQEWWGGSVYGIAGKTSQLNPEILSDSWSRDIGIIDWFVLEGVLFHRLIAYGYAPQKYRSDSKIMQALTAVLIWIPQKVEIFGLAYFLNPINHWKVIRLAAKEASGEVPLKDYQWSAVYRHKWMYRGLNLTGPRWPTSWLNGHPSSWWRRIAYVFGQYARFLWAIASFPGSLAARAMMMLRALRKRQQGTAFLPPVLTESQSNSPLK